jgi:hypothetical protein
MPLKASVYAGFFFASYSDVPDSSVGRVITKSVSVMPISVLIPLDGCLCFISLARDE